MTGEPETIFSADTGSKIVLALVGALLGFLASYVLDRMKRRREPRKRISYDLIVGAGMASVPPELAEKVAVTFAGDRVDGQLYEVRARVTNTGNQVVKKQYLRFSFPEKSTVLDTYLVESAPPEFGVQDAPLENQDPSDFRWLIGHIEKGESVEFGMLVVSSHSSAPKVIGYNEEGGVELESIAAAARNDDADHIEPLILFTVLSIFAPPAVEAARLFAGSLTNVLEMFIRIALLAGLLPHVLPVARLVAKRMIAKPEVSGAVRIQNESGPLFLATGSSMIRASLSDSSSKKGD
jgi:hypothetical protein